jgi:hypothetical protein
MENKSETKNCQNCKKDFQIEAEDFNFYEKIKVPAPTWCPECRMARRMIWRNERVLYKAVCGLCGKNMISMHNPKSVSMVFCDVCWWGDGWEGTNYQFSYDWDTPFFEQWSKLQKLVPLIQTWRFNNINCDYLCYATDAKNCYSASSIVGSEEVAYSYAVDKSRDILDSAFINKSNLCYENIDSQNNYNCIFLKYCTSCIDSGFLSDCSNCQSCFLSSNLRNKKYVFKNIQYSKSEYISKLSEIETGRFLILKKLLSEFNEIKEKKSIYKYIQVINGKRCSGDNILNCKDVINSFNVYNSENITHSFRVGDCKDCMDVAGLVRSELIYEGVSPSCDGADSHFCITSRSSHDIKFCFLCSSSSHLFGCVGLKNKKYCILNHQYTKEQYEELVPKIIKHMNDMPYIDNKGRVYRYGEFFPPELSPFCYNETIAQEYFPLTKAEALNQGYRWKDPEERNYQIEIKNIAIPDNIQEVKDEIIGKVIECAHQGKCNEQCTEAFKIIQSELQFYRRMNLPLPRLCPNCRHYQRLKQRNPLNLWHRVCMCEKENHSHQGKCNVEFETSYAPERPEIVYCEKCYQAEVY